MTEEAKARATEGDAPAPVAPEATKATVPPSPSTGGDEAKATKGDEVRGKTPRTIGAFMWAVILASFALSATTWIALAELSGFTEKTAAGTVTWHLSWLMPVVVDGYVVVALLTWMAPVPRDVAEFARRNTYFAAALGTLVQSGYHATLGARESLVNAVLALIMGAMPPGFAALAIHMRTIVIRRSVQPARAAHATHATHTAPSRQAEAPPAPSPKATPPRPPKATPALEAPKAKAPARVAPEPVGGDELGEARAKHHARLLYEAWGDTPPKGDRRANAKAVLKVASATAAPAVKLYNEMIKSPSGEAKGAAQ